MHPEVWRSRRPWLRNSRKRGLSEEIKIVETGCNGFCAMGPIMVVYPEGVIYMQIKPEDIPELVEEHLVKGRVLERLLYREPDDGRASSPPCRRSPSSPCRNCGS